MIISYCNIQDKCIVSLAGIDFVTVLEAILTSRLSTTWEITVFVVEESNTPYSQMADTREKTGA